MRKAVLKRDSGFLPPGVVEIGVEETHGHDLVAWFTSAGADRIELVTLGRIPESGSDELARHLQEQCGFAAETSREAASRLLGSVRREET